MSYGNKVYNGKKGKIWIEDIRYTNCYDYELNMEFAYEEIDDPDGFGKVQVPNGFSITGKVVLKRDGTEQALVDALVEAGKKNMVPDLAIVGSMSTNDGKNGNKYRVEDVTVDSVQVQKFAKDSATTDLELAIKARTIDKI